MCMLAIEYKYLLIYSDSTTTTATSDLSSIKVGESAAGVEHPVHRTQVVCRALMLQGDRILLACPHQALHTTCKHTQIKSVFRKISTG